MHPEVVREMRSLLGLNQEQAADALGVSTRTYQRYESEGAPQHIALALIGVMHVLVNPPGPWDKNRDPEPADYWVKLREFILEDVDEELKAKVDSWQEGVKRSGQG